MAFGDRKGSGLSGGSTDITDPASITGSISVAIGDLVWCVFAQQDHLTVVGASDNLGNTYVTDGSGIGGTAGGEAVHHRCLHSRVTVAGTLTQIDFNTTASSDNWSAVADVFEGPFESNPKDTNGTPSSIGFDNFSPFTSPASLDPLDQPNELIVCGSTRTANAITATSPALKGTENTSISGACATIGYLLVNSTDSVTLEFTGTNPNVGIYQIVCFKQLTTPGTVTATEDSDTASSTGTVEWQAILAATETSDTASMSGTLSGFAGTLAATEEPDRAYFPGYPGDAPEWTDSVRLRRLEREFLLLDSDAQQTFLSQLPPRYQKRLR